MTADQELVDRLDEVWTSIDAVGGALGEAEWKLETECPGWTVQDQVAHLAHIEWRLLGRDEVDHTLPDDLPHEEVLGHARPYLGPIASRRSDWTPLLRWADSFAGFARPRPADDDVWQFSTFLVHGPA